LSRRIIRARRRATRKREQLILWGGIGGAVLFLVGVVVFIALNRQSGALTQYEAGKPGAGALAPEFSLPAVGGGTFSLSDYRGQENVLLFFQEGVG